MMDSAESIILYPEDAPPASILGSGAHDLSRLFVLAMTEDSAIAWNSVRGNVEAVPFREMRVADWSRSHAVDYVQLSEFTDRLLSDPRTFFMMIRQWSPGIIDASVFNLMPRLSTVCLNILSLLRREQPRALLYWSSPHLVEAWILAKFAEFLSIPVLIAARGVLPGQSVLVQGLDEHRIVAPNLSAATGDGVEDRLRRDIAEYMRIMTTQYSDAMPIGHRRALRRSASGGWSFRAESHAFRKHVQASSGVSALAARTLYGIRRSATRRVVSQEYARLAIDGVASDRTITLFLHYQPERTTLPEAGRYGNQYELARTIAIGMPKDWTLLVREHPATFVGPGSFFPGFRSAELYESIASLPRTRLVPLSSDPFSLIDDSAIVVTCTGTVGLESLCRGTPVIVAGLAPYRDAPGTLALDPLGSDDALSQVAAFCTDVIAGKSSVSRSGLDDYLVARSLRAYRGGDAAWSHEAVYQRRAHAQAVQHGLLAAKSGDV